MGTSTSNRSRGMGTSYFTDDTVKHNPRAVLLMVMERNGGPVPVYPRDCGVSNNKNIS